MALLEFDEPTAAALRWWGLPFALFFALVGALVWTQAGSPIAAQGVWAAAGSIVVIYYAMPRSRRAIYRAWMLAGYPIGWLMSHMVMAATYYLVLTPIGLLLRASGRDMMQRRFDSQTNSYWQPRRERADRSSYFRQF